jgi:uncharacterized caspase-like protein
MAKDTPKRADEIRYALLVGIDDYEDRTLDYASSDAASMRDMLVQRCAVDSSRAFTIISSTAKPKRETYADLERIIRDIQVTFRPKKDSIVFYFAGHGEQHFGVSNLLFHENQVPLGRIAELLKPLDARFLTCIIDACESGTFESFRGSRPNDDSVPTLAERLIQSSEGICIISSCTGDEKARERKALGHGVFTHFLLDVISVDSNYDEDGILSIHRIAEKVGKGTTTSTQFQQHPVTDLRSTGFYPFAFLPQQEVKAPSESTTHMSTQTNATEKAATPTLLPATTEVMFPMVSVEQREQVMNGVKAWFSQERSRLFKLIDDDQYEIDNGDDLEAFSDISAAVDEQVVLASRKAKIEAAGEIFSSRKEKDPMYQLWPNSFVNLFLKEEQKYRLRFDIDWSQGHAFGNSVAFHSKKPELPAVGFGFVVYQAKFGMGLAIVSYTTIWDGFENITFNQPFVHVFGFKFDNNIVNHITSEIELQYAGFKTHMENWKKGRLAEIEDAGKKYR